MRPMTLFALCSAMLFTTTGSAFAERVEARTELLQTGEPARVHNPDCSSGFPINASDLILWVGSAAIDSYIGYPVTARTLENLNEGNRNWLKVRLGIHDGPSHCATQCVIYPKGVSAKWSACLSETGGDGLQCNSGSSDYSWGRMENFTHSSTDQGNVFCASAKNWSHNRNRWFTVRVDYDNVYKIRVKSSCSYAAQLHVYYRDLQTNEWKGDGPWTVNASETFTLSDSGRALRTANRLIYYYAEIPGENYSWAGEQQFYSEGLRKGRVVESASDGAMQVDLNCDNKMLPLF